MGILQEQTMVVQSCRYRHPVLGQVKVTVRANSSKISARWVGSEIQVNIPPMLPVKTYDDFIAKYQDSLALMRPKQYFFIGQHIESPDISISIVESPKVATVAVSVNKAKSALPGPTSYTLSVGTALLANGIGTPSVQSLINQNVIACAIHSAKSIVIDQARASAKRIGRAPLGWLIKDSKRALGKCSSSGIITLSPRLIFMPHELREFVICHEIAHLSELNHSPAFHSLCNSYLGGREKELSLMARKYKFPVF